MRIFTESFMTVPDMEQLLDIDSWLERFREKITALFGSRLLFFGLQGSYGRGEQNADSDIDVVVILDEVRFSDLKAYREMTDRMPESRLICGFVAGERELVNWEKSDLLQLFLDTRPIIGSLDKLKTMFTDEDVRRSVLTGACGLYHACSHNFLHEKDCAALAGLYKSARFTVRMKHYHETGEYTASLNELAGRIPETDREILDTAVMMRTGMDGNTFDAASRKLIEWSSGIILRLQ